MRRFFRWFGVYRAWHQRLDQRINSEIDIRKTHPNLARLITTLAVIHLLLGVNFVILQPTFLIFAAPNLWWGSIFLMLGAGEVVFLNLYRRLRLVRACMVFSAAYMFVLAWGTTQPYFEGVGSLQLPILYVGLAVIQVPLALEPFINPWTSKK